MTSWPRVVPCAFCGKPVEAHLAPGVRLFEAGARYFCSTEHALSFAPAAPSPGRPAPVEYGSDPGDATHESATHESATHEVTLGLPRAPLSAGQRAQSVDESEEAPPSTGTSSGPSSGLSEGQPARDFLKPPSWELAPLGLLTLSTLSSLSLGEAGWWMPATLALTLGLTLWEKRALEQQSQAARIYAEVVRERLSEPAKGAREGEFVPPEKVRVGQEVVVAPGDVLPADGVVVVGRGQVFLPTGLSIAVGPGTNVLGGCLFTGDESLRIRAQRVGKGRALTALLGNRVHSTLDAYWSVRAGRVLALWIAPLLGAVALGLTRMFGEPWSVSVSLGAATWACLGGAMVRDGAFWLAAGLLSQLEARGVIFPDAQVLGLAGSVGTAVFCARGTVQQGSPRVAEIHPLRGLSESYVLSLAAGALASVHHPTAEAVLVAARELGTSPNSCRSHASSGGANMQCRSQAGLDVTVGGREFLLRQRISIAWVEEKLRSIEGQAHTVLLVAEGDQLVGVIALSDDLAPGARATMQQLLVSGIEPALLSGDSRETTEALARRLHIDHVRPEAKPQERRKEVERLRSAGLPVAVVGRPGTDDASLLGSDLPVLIGGARGYSPSFSGKDEARSVGVWSGKLRDAGLALVVAHSLRRETSQLLLFRGAPALIAFVAVTLLVVPFVALPLASLLGQWLAHRLLKRASTTLVDP